LNDTIKLTQHSRSSGCGCKIAPAVLQEILKSSTPTSAFEKLIVGNESNDDAAVFDIGNNQAIISTTDFFMPIVDDAYDFGKIAAANAISDVYAMGGKPLMAIAILGWPIGKLSNEIAQQVIAGGRNICHEAGIPLAGGHSIDALEPMFGLAVTGIVAKHCMKKNNTAKQGDLIYLTKKIGVGILATAEKRGLLREEHQGIAVSQMTALNSFGALAATQDYVSAMTDVTGFGLLGHLIEMAEGAALSAELHYNKIPLIAGLQHYTTQMCVPDNTFRNFNAYQNKTSTISGEQLFTLCDPQTNGGLLITIDAKHQTDFETFMKANGLSDFAMPIGSMKERGASLINVM
jgi:selenide, water dikinase